MMKNMPVSIQLDIIRDYLEWQFAIHGGSDPRAMELHHRLVGEQRPKPTIEAALAAVEEIEQLRAWHENTVPIIAALAIYGEGANVKGLVEKARALNEAER